MTKRPAGALTYADPTVVDYYSKVQNFYGTLPTGVIEDENPQFHDLTDGAGHGILIATDALYLNITFTGAVTVNFQTYLKLFYRLKAVGVEEYIGIVQSQQ